jgi:hypothetical protein
LPVFERRRSNSIYDWEASSLPSGLRPFCLTAKLGRDFELNVLRKENEIFGFLKSATDDTVVFNSNGKVTVLSKQFLENNIKIAKEVETNLKRLDMLIEFIHKYQNSLDSFNQKAAKKKLNKKEQEKQNQVRDEMINGVVSDFKENLENLGKASHRERADIYSTRSKFLLALLTNWSEDVIDAPNVFNFDLFKQNVQAKDNFGRRIEAHVNKKFDYSRLDFDTALKLTNENANKLGSFNDLRSVKSGSNDAPKISDLRAIFEQFITLLNPEVLDSQLFTFNGSSARHFYTQGEFDNIKARLEDKKNLSLNERVNAEAFTIYDMSYHIQHHLRERQNMITPLTMSETVDVLNVKSIEYPKEDDQLTLRTFFTSKAPLNRCNFQEGFSEYQKWVLNYTNTSKVFGNFETKGISPAEKLRNKNIKIQYYFNLNAKENYLTFEQVVKGSSKPLIAEINRQMSIHEQRSQLHPNTELILNNSEGEINPPISPKNRLPQPSVKSQSKGTFFNTRTSVKDLQPKFVTNYFDTLNGRNYLIENPLPTNPAILTTNDKILIAELLKKASQDESEFQKTNPQINGLKTTTWKMETGFERKTNSFQVSSSNKQEKTVSILKSSNEHGKQSTQSFKASIDTQHIFSKISANDIIEQQALDYRNKKSVNFNLYGQKRETLPPVKSLYQHPTVVKIPNNTTLDVDKNDNRNLRASMVSHSIVATSRVETKIDKKPSSIHMIRNNAPHKQLLMSLDKGFKGHIGNVPQSANSQKQVQLVHDLIIFPEVIDFGTINISHTYETKFTIVNKGKSLQRVLIKPPLYCPNISVVKEQGPFAPGLMKTVKVILDTRAFKKGPFAQEIRISSEMMTYKLRICGNVEDPNDPQDQMDTSQKENLVFTHLKDTPKQIIHYKVKEIKNRDESPSKVDSSDLKNSQLPRIFYDANYKVF